MKSYHVYSFLEGHLFCFSLWNQPADAAENGRRRQRASRGLLVGALGWREGEKRKSALWMWPCPCSQGTLEKRCTRKDGPCGREKEGLAKKPTGGSPVEHRPAEVLPPVYTQGVEWRLCWQG